MAEAGTDTGQGAAGHRWVPDGNGRVIEAWGPDAATCLTEALVALVDGFAEVNDAPTAHILPVSVGEGPEDALTSLVEEVIDTIRTFSVVPVRFHLAETEDGGFAGDMEVVPMRNAVLKQPIPTAVSFAGLSMGTDGSQWSCHVRVDL
jgi:SHS2 domain-containing protein